MALPEQNGKLRSKPGRAKPSREDLQPGESLCDHCVAKCCRYFALPLDTPTRRKDFDTFRWFLLHELTSIFVEKGTWYLQVHTECRHLLPDNRCGIYETRPQICRDHSTVDCEYDDDWTYDLFFETPDQLAEYVEVRFPPRRGSIRSPRPGLPVLRTMAK
jgi:Fe-S-cluster containining protein